MEIHYRMKELNEEYLRSMKKSEPESKAALIRCPHCGNLFRL
jgi:DNA-directed RNA polymerase subunit RPC12/RpoP